MKIRSASAFSPAGISSFFEICDTTCDGKPIINPERVGARGGGFVISRGVFTEIRLLESNQNQIEVLINGKQWPEANTTKTVVETLLERVIVRYKVTVRHRVDVPIGAGFGSSGAGALSTALALSKVLGLNLTFNQLGRIAHVAEIKCLTGLGTVGPLMLGGCILTMEPGAPGYSVIDRIPITSNLMIVAGVYESVLTKAFLSTPRKRELVNKFGKKTLNKILDNPSLYHFMQACKEFAMKTGIVTKRIQKLIELAEKAGAIGATQNMIGEAVHAVVPSEKKQNVIRAFQKVLPNENIIVARITQQGAHRLKP